MATYLSGKKCLPCEGGTLPLSRKQAAILNEQVKDWNIAPDTLSIFKEFQFTNFGAALAFVNMVGSIAEAENHHPDINIHGYRNVRITLSTHAIKGLSENDFIMASKIDLL